MSRIRVVPVVLIALFLMATGAPHAIAQDATPVAQADITPPGADYEVWAAAWGQWVFSFPAAISPVADESGAACGLGQTGSTFFLAPSALDAGEITRACTIPEGASVLVPVIAVDCSTAEADPFHGDDADSLGTCAASNADAASASYLSVDGTDVADIASYRVQSGVFSIVLPEGNILGAPAGVASVVVGGAFVNVEGLAAGEHTISFGSTYRGGDATDITYHITVMSAPVPGS